MLPTTVTGDGTGATHIDAGNAAAVDWRADYDALTCISIDVSASARGGVLALTGRLGLRFGALDVVVTPDEQWIFLEINSNGQWHLSKRPPDSPSPPL